MHDILTENKTGMVFENGPKASEKEHRFLREKCQERALNKGGQKEVQVNSSNEIKLVITESLPPDKANFSLIFPYPVPTPNFHICMNFKSHKRCF